MHRITVRHPLWLAGFWLLIVLISPPVRAAKVPVCYGQGERLVSLSPTRLRDSTGAPLEIGHRMSFRCFGARYTVRSEGLVLMPAGQVERYLDLPEGESLARLQQAGSLPTPLPPAELDLGDWVWGHMLWLLLLGAGTFTAMLGRHALLTHNTERAARNEPTLPVGGRIWAGLFVVGAVTVLGGFAGGFVVITALSFLG